MNQLFMTLIMLEKLQINKIQKVNFILGQKDMPRIKLNQFKLKKLAYNHNLK